MLSALASMALVLFHRVDRLLEEPRGGQSMNQMGSQEFSEIKQEAAQETNTGEWVTWSHEDGSRYEGEARK